MKHRSSLRIIHLKLRIGMFNEPNTQLMQFTNGVCVTRIFIRNDDLEVILALHHKLNTIEPHHTTPATTPTVPGPARKTQSSAIPAGTKTVCPASSTTSSNPPLRLAIEAPIDFASMNTTGPTESPSKSETSLQLALTTSIV